MNDISQNFDSASDSGLRRRLELVTTISKRSDGSMRDQVHRGMFLSKLNIKPHEVTLCNLVHGEKIVYIRDSKREKVIHGVDGLITRSPDLFPAFLVADCFPVFFSSVTDHVVGLAHAGWAGVARGIVSSMAQEIQKHTHVPPARLTVSIGAGIRECHFEVKKDVSSKFRKYPESIAVRKGKIFVNLPKIIKTQLLAAGVSPRHIIMGHDCTYCLNEQYFSYRRDRTEERMMAIIGVRNLLR